MTASKQGQDGTAVPSWNSREDAQNMKSFITE